MDSDRFDVRLAGLGGQGLLLAGLILGEAVTIYDKKNAVQTVHYAPLARGAPSRAEVVISESQIFFPEVEEANLLLVISQDSFNEFRNHIKPAGIIIADSSNIDLMDEEQTDIYQIPISDIAKRETGRSITGSVLGLGIISIVTEIVTPEALVNAVKSRAPRGTVQLNLKALEAGFEVGRGLN